MSVNALRESIEKPGCRWVVGVISFLFVIGFSGVLKCNQNAQGPDQLQSSANTGQKLATIGDFVVYEGTLEKSTAQEAALITATPGTIANAFGRALDAEITHGLLLQVAKERNISLDDKSILSAASRQLDQSVEQQKMMMVMQKQLPENATNDDVVKKINPQLKSYAAAKQAQLDGIQKELSDPAQREQLLGGMANEIVDQGIQDSLNITDDQLKHSRDQYHTKKIYFDSTKHPGVDIRNIAAGALADIKSHKITFEQAMDKYSDDPPPGKGKPKHENIAEVDMTTIKASKDYAPISNLKKGEFSDVLPQAPGGYAIYRLDSIESPPIPDFEKTKATIRAQYAQTMAASELQDGLTKVKNENLIKWQAPGWQLLNDWYQTLNAQDSTFRVKPIAEQHKIDMDYVQKALGLITQDEKGACLAAAGGIDPVWSAASDKEKKDLQDQYMKVLKAFLNNFGCYSAEMDYAKLAAEKGLKSEAFGALSQAASINEQAVDSSDGQKNFGDLSEMLANFQAKNLLTPDEVKTVQQKLDDYRKEKVAYDKQMEQDKKDAEVARKKAEEDRKKQEAIDKAKAKAAPPIIVKPTPGTTTTPPSITLPPGATSPVPSAAVNPPGTLPNGAPPSSMPPPRGPIHMPPPGASSGPIKGAKGPSLPPKTTGR